MAKQRKRKYRLVLRKSSPLLQGLMLAAVVLSTVALVALRASIENSHSQYEAMRMQAAALEAQNQELTICIDELGTQDSAIRIAMEELGLVLPDTILLTPGN